MMDTPLLVRSIAERAELLFGNREIVSLTADAVERSTYGEVVERARRLADALTKLGVRPGDRVGTFAWNSRRHLELYLAIPAMGAVLHTLNIRLFPEDLDYIANHAEDKVVFVDASLAGQMPRFACVQHEVLMPDGPGEREGALDYEELIASGDPSFRFPDVDENAAAAMCYTSGTTGRPKGVVYSQRSTVLHTLITNQADCIGLTERDTVMPVVPMFHANAWGLAYAATMAGARLAMPGPRMTPQDIVDLMAAEQVTTAAGVPTIWQGVLGLESTPELPHLRQVLCGGSAVPEGLMRAWDDRFGAPIVQAWGMTETSPLASIARLPVGSSEDPDEQYKLRALQGRVVPMVDVRLDEEAGGELLVRGPTIAAAYYNDDTAAEKFTEDGWLRTGDVAEMDEAGNIKLVDRAKDLVKSGGEWISSVQLENEIMAHPDVAEAAVVAVPDERWSERPCACVVVRPGHDLDPEDLRGFLRERVAKWWVPERVEIIDEVPKTSVGKFDKKVLRAKLAEQDAAS
jgi:fatty-acyl-CoA synthase